MLFQMYAFGNATCTVCLIAAGVLIYIVQALVYFHPYMHTVFDNAK